MKHKKYIELIHLWFIDELNPQSKIELDEHLKNCEQCNADFTEMTLLKNNLEVQKMKEPDEKLLLESRKDLKLKLNNLKNGNSFFTKIFYSLHELFIFNYKLALSGAALLLAGIALGYVFFSPSNNKMNEVVSVEQGDLSLLQSNIQISNMQLITTDETNGQVEVSFDAVKPVRFKGNVYDERIQKFLTYSVLHDENPGMRLNTINLIGSKQSKNLDKEIKEALISVLKFDENLGVRREALKTIKKLPFDDLIKEAYLFILQNDKNSSLKIEVINSLLDAKKEGHKFTEKEMKMFKEKSQTDDNNYIRVQMKNILGGLF